MNQPKTVGMSITLTRAFLLLATGLLIWTSAAAAQEKLGDLVEEAGFNWMIGRWTATTDDGQEIEMTYKWGLDKYMATVDFKMGEYAYHGMIFYVPNEQKVVEVGLDNRGGTAKGTWDMEGEKAISKSERTQADGETMRAAMLHSEVDAETMKVAVYRIEETGEQADEPWATLQFKRQKKQPPQKAGNAFKTEEKTESMTIAEIEVELTR
jgi:hypothetical protein